MSNTVSVEEIKPISFETKVHAATFKYDFLPAFLALLVPYEKQHEVNRTLLDKRLKGNKSLWEFWYEGTDKVRFKSFRKDIRKNLWPEFNQMYPQAKFKGKK